MVLGNKGQGMILAIMLFVMAAIVAVIVSRPLMEFTNEARLPTTSTAEPGMPDSTGTTGGLDCDNSSISNGVLMTCLVIDLILPFFIATIIIAGTAYFFYFIGRG